MSFITFLIGVGGTSYILVWRPSWAEKPLSWIGLPEKMAKTWSKPQ